MTRHSWERDEQIFKFLCLISHFVAPSGQRLEAIEKQTSEARSFPFFHGERTKEECDGTLKRSPPYIYIYIISFKQSCHFFLTFVPVSFRLFSCLVPPPFFTVIFFFFFHESYLTYFTRSTWRFIFPPIRVVHSMAPRSAESSLSSARCWAARCHSGFLPCLLTLSSPHQAQVRLCVRVLFFFL